LHRHDKHTFEIEPRGKWKEEVANAAVALHGAQKIMRSSDGHGACDEKLKEGKPNEKAQKTSGQCAVYQPEQGKGGAAVQASGVIREKEQN